MGFSARQPSARALRHGGVHDECFTSTEPRAKKRIFSSTRVKEGCCFWEPAPSQALAAAAQGAPIRTPIYLLAEVLAKKKRQLSSEMRES